MMNGFIYNEFYPDYEYDNTRYAIDDCIELILCKKQMEFTPWFAKEGISLNSYTNLKEEKLKEIVNACKKKFDDIELKEVNNVACNLQKENCTITGTPETVLVFDNMPVTIKGNWLVEFVWDEGFWNMVNVQIEGVEL